VTSPDVPEFYDDLKLSLEEARRMLEQGAANRRAAAHHPVVATSDTKGMPQQRVMILRDVSWASRELRFNTDNRSAKINQANDGGMASVLIYDEPAKVQLRLTGKIRVETDGTADTAWTTSTTFARRCYMAQAAPGNISPGPTSGLPNWIEGKQPEEAQLESARANFAVMIVTIDSLEWLYLANAGHRRAIWHWDDPNRMWSGDWLVP
jgi:pyridoxamine 5'-phosphate oxidase